MNWIKTADYLPPEHEIVETKIDDESGVRNKGTLYRSNNLWVLADGSMYVYYVPTHWRYLV